MKKKVKDAISQTQHSAWSIVKAYKDNNKTFTDTVEELVSLNYAVIPQYYKNIEGSDVPIGFLVSNKTADNFHTFSGLIAMAFKSSSSEAQFEGYRNEALEIAPEAIDQLRNVRLTFLPWDLSVIPNE